MVFGKKLQCPEVTLNLHVPGCTGWGLMGGGGGHGTGGGGPAS